MSVEAILKAFSNVTSKSVEDEWVVPYKAPADPSVNQFTFFFKPEVTDTKAGINFKVALELGLNKLKESGVEFGAIRVIGGSYLDKTDAMVKHYGVIAQISKEGPSVITQSAKENLDKMLKDQPGAEVMGGHQFLKLYPDFTPFSLSVVNDNLGTTRLAGGTYAMSIKVSGKPYIVLNPFHAYQLVPYTTPGNAIVALECRSKMAWGDLREKLAGVTNPNKAVEGSIRNLFLVNKDKIGLKEVSSGCNGVHMSAGPLEGMVELPRFFGPLEYKDTAFGALLVSKGVSVDGVGKLADNPDFDVEGKKVSAFDLTEELCAGVSADKLVKLSK